MTREAEHEPQIQYTYRQRGMGCSMTAPLLLILVGVLGLVGLLAALSPGRLAPLVDKTGRQIKGSLSEKVFVGMGQVAYQLRSEVAAHNSLREAYRAQGDTAMVRRLELAAVSLVGGLSNAWMRLRDEAMHRVGVGITRVMTSVITGVFLPIWRNPAYTLREKIAIWRGKTWSRNILWDEILHTDLTVTVPRLEIPVYFFVGQHDYTTNHDLARDYFQRLDAPQKKFLHIQQLGAQSAVRGTGKGAGNPATGCSCQKNVLSDPILPETPR